MVQSLWLFLPKLHILLPYALAILLLCVSPKELEKHKTCTQMFMAALV